MVRAARASRQVSASWQCWVGMLALLAVSVASEGFPDVGGVDHTESASSVMVEKDPTGTKDGAATEDEPLATDGALNTTPNGAGRKLWFSWRWSWSRRRRRYCSCGYKSSSWSCRRCTGGRYSPAGYSTSCRYCPGGRYSRRRTRNCSCRYCGSGYYSRRGSTVRKISNRRHMSYS